MIEPFFRGVGGQVTLNGSPVPPWFLGWKALGCNPWGATAKTLLGCNIGVATYGVQSMGCNPWGATAKTPLGCNIGVATNGVQPMGCKRQDPPRV